MTKPIMIMGGGATGLYLRSFLYQHGYDVILVEKKSLGDGQTIASQGIIHRGLKYSLSDKTSSFCKMLDASFNSWSRHFLGQGCVDLRKLEYNSKTMYFWSTLNTKINLLHTIKTKIASLALKSHVQEVKYENYPHFFPQKSQINLFEIDEPCINMRSFLQLCRDIDAGQMIYRDNRNLVDLCAQFEPRCVIFAAGVGNESLLAEIGIENTKFCQRRPLDMIAIRDMEYRLHGHCLQDFSDKPTYTITSVAEDSRHTWYVGGNIAENKDKLLEEQQKKILRDLLHETIHIDVNTSRMIRIRIDRAEGLHHDRRPDGPTIFHFKDNALKREVFAVWPTKLVLLPSLADMLRQRLDDGDKGIRNLQFCGTNELQIADYPWRFCS